MPVAFGSIEGSLEFVALSTIRLHQNEEMLPTCYSNTIRVTAGYTRTSTWAQRLSEPRARKLPKRKHPISGTGMFMNEHPT